MAASLFAREVSELCLGKPALTSLPLTATVADALSALKCSQDNFIPVWNCNHITESNNQDQNRNPHNTDYDGYDDECVCVGKISMADVICYLFQDERNLMSPSEALKSSVSVLLPKSRGLVVHVKPSCMLIEAIDLMLQGAQNLIVPIRTRSVTRKRSQSHKPNTTFSISSSISRTTHRNGLEFCWLAQEDVIRFLLGSISLFSPISALSLSDLGISSESHAILAVDSCSAASSAVAALSRASSEQIAVAVVEPDEDRTVLIGEISPHALACCDETVAGALATLSAGDFLAYIDGGAPAEWLVRVVKARLAEKGLVEMAKRVGLLNLSSYSSGSSSDEESPARSFWWSGSFSTRRSEAIMCSPKSSLVAVMIQAIAHRVNHVWVMDEDCSLIGLVTFTDILKVFREHTLTLA